MRQFLISDTVAEVVGGLRSKDNERAYNFASLVAWRVERHGSWLTDSERDLVAKVLKSRPKARRPKGN